MKILTFQIVEGSTTAGFALIAFMTLLDFPSTSRYMSERERKLALSRIQYDSLISRQTDTVTTHVQALKVSLINWRTWLFVLGYCIITATTSQSYFYPTLVESLGYTGTTIQYMVGDYPYNA